jgi:hypothetical protein
MKKFVGRAVAASVIFVGLGSLVLTYNNLSTAMWLVGFGITTLILLRER